MPLKAISISVCTIIIFLLTTVVHANNQTGLDAFYRGDYSSALKEWRLLANKGDVNAQYQLGVMYHLGKGVPQDFSEAIRWYRLAAEKGNAEALSTGSRSGWFCGVRELSLVIGHFSNTHLKLLLFTKFAIRTFSKIVRRLTFTGRRRVQ